MAHAYKFGFSTAPPRYFLPAAALVPLTANATNLTDCPHAIADYATYTPTEFYSGRPTDQLGSPFNFLSETDTCFTTPVAEWCDESIAVVPSGTPDPDKPLFLFFHGAGNRPTDHTHIANTAAYAGYPTILLSWDGSSDGVPLTRSTLCIDLDVDHDDNPDTDGIDLYGGECTDGCLYDLGVEMLTGADKGITTDVAWKYTPRPIRSVVQRTAIFLNDLHLFEVNSDPDNDLENNYEWDQYCRYHNGETQIHWDNVVVGGFSMGANMASFISFTEGTHGLLAIQGGADICTDIDPITYDDTVGLAEYYDTFEASNIECGDGTCESRVMAFHGNQNQVWETSKAAGLVPHMSVLGFHLDDDDLEIDLDNGFLDIDTAIDFSSQTANIMTSSQDPAPDGVSYHGSMAVNEKMPMEVSGQDAVDPLDGENSSDTYLFPAYLEAMCWLQ